MLENPIWYSLLTEQRHLAEGNALAKRFPTDVAPLGAMRDQSAAAYQALEEVVSGDAVALFLDTEPAPPSDWTMVYADQMYQMIYEGAPGGGDHHNGAFQELTHADIPEMKALTKLTEPGPFRQRTIDLGSYFGIYESGSLVALAGERLHFTGFTEVSAVCTHPKVRGRGYGKILVSAVVRGIMQRGETPILHVRTGNVSAVRLYEGLGFKVRGRLHLAIVKQGAAPDNFSPTGNAE
jgi:ribosomal protein S18 acetylase RimI-like enzyme